MPKPVRRITDPNLIAMAHLMHDLQAGYWTVRELAERCGLTYLTVQRYCAALHQVGACYICRWEKDKRGAETIRVYKLGEGVDVRNDVETHAEKMRRLRARWKRERGLGP